MFRKVLLLFSLLVCTCGEVLAQNTNTTDTSFILGGKPSWFHQYCNSLTTACTHRVTGIDKIKDWNDEYFKRHGETTTTMFSFELEEGLHAKEQRAIIEYIISGTVNQHIPGYYVDLRDFSYKPDYNSLSPGDIVTHADTRGFGAIGARYYDFSEIQAVVVAAAGNITSVAAIEKMTTKTYKIKALKDAITKLPFPLIAGGVGLSTWRKNCSDNSNHCNGLFRRGKIKGGGSAVCGDRGKEICILAPFSFEVVGVSGSGTSVSAAYLGATVWAVAYFLKNRYKWVEPMTQLQAAVTAVAIVKSCAVDIGEPGPDYENGLGVLNLYCLYDDKEEDGFIANPMSLINPKLHLPPNDSYTTPQVVGFDSTPIIDGKEDKKTTETTDMEPGGEEKPMPTPPPVKPVVEDKPSTSTEPVVMPTTMPIVVVVEPDEEEEPMPPPPPVKPVVVDKPSTPTTVVVMPTTPVVVVTPKEEETTPTTVDPVVDPDEEEKPSTSTEPIVKEKVGIRVRVKLFLELPLR